MSRASCGLPLRVLGSARALAVVLPLAGCARSAEFVLRQPLAPPSQQNLKLTSEYAYRATADGRDMYALTFPLPGSAGGPRAFVVYLSAPAGRGRVAVDPLSSGGARGFLIQELGALAGRSDFVAGSIAYRRVLFAPRLRRVDLNVRCEDGSEITGRALVEDGAREVQVLEREFAADIAGLSPPESQPVADDQSGAPGTLVP